MKIVLSFFLLLLSIVSIASAEVLDVNIKGVDNGIKTNKQQDYKEAVMNAKLQAIEQAGASIESITKVVNFEIKYDAVESQSKAILLPGFQIIDIGYLADGTYQVVLVGKIQAGDKDSFETGALRYAKSLVDRGKREEAKRELEKIIESKDSESREGAIFHYGMFGFESLDETTEKLRSWYPNSKYITRIQQHLDQQKKAAEESTRRERRASDLKKRASVHLGEYSCERGREGLEDLIFDCTLSSKDTGKWKRRTWSNVQDCIDDTCYVEREHKFSYKDEDGKKDRFYYLMTTQTVRRGQTNIELVQSCKICVNNVCSTDCKETVIGRFKIYPGFGWIRSMHRIDLK